MHTIKTIQKIILTSTLAVILSACGGSLQNSRLDNAEQYISQAEHAVQRSNINVADNSLGTARAFLATVGDFKKSLNIHELRRYQSLKQRETNLARAIQNMK